MAAPQEHSFPKLKLTEILTTLKELDIPANSEDIKNPQAGSVRIIYENFLAYLMGVEKEHFSQPQFSAIDKLSYPDLHDESIPELAFIRAIAKLARTAGVAFQVQSDLLEPEKTKLMNLISAIINFAKFTETTRETNDELRIEQNSLLEEKERLELELQKENLILQQMKQKRESETQQIAQLQEECNTMQGQVAQLNQAQAELQTSNRKLKQDVISVADNITLVKGKLHDLKEKCLKVESQIVRDPAAMEKKLKDLKERISLEQSLLNELEMKQQNDQRRMDNIARTEKEIQRASKALDELGSDMNKKRSARESKKAKIAQLNSVQLKIKDVENNQASVNRNIKATREKSIRQQNSHIEKTNMADQKKQEADRQKKAALSEQAQIATTIEQNTFQCAVLQRKTEDLKREHEEGIERIKQQIDQVEVQVSKSNQNFALALKSV